MGVLLSLRDEFEDEMALVIVPFYHVFQGPFYFVGD